MHFPNLFRDCVFKNRGCRSGRRYYFFYMADMTVNDKVGISFVDMNGSANTLGQWEKIMKAEILPNTEKEAQL